MRRSYLRVSDSCESEDVRCERNADNTNVVTCTDNEGWIGSYLTDEGLVGESKGGLVRTKNVLTEEWTQTECTSPGSLYSH